MIIIVILLSAGVLKFYDIINYEQASIIKSNSNNNYEGEVYLNSMPTFFVFSIFKLEGEFDDKGDLKEELIKYDSSKIHIRLSNYIKHGKDK